MTQQIIDRLQQHAIERAHAATALFMKAQELQLQASTIQAEAARLRNVISEIERFVSGVDAEAPEAPP